MTGTGAIGSVGDVETVGPRLESGAWQPAPLELVICEPLEDEARRSAAQKNDAQLVDLYAIAARAHTEAVDGGAGREGEADYWDVLRRAIVEEAARRPNFGKDELTSDDSGGRRQRRRLRKHLEALLAAREAELAAPAGGVVVDGPPGDRVGAR